MGLQLTGELRSVIAKKAGDTDMRQYQILTKDKDKERLFDVDDFDLNRKLELNKEVTLNVFVSAWTSKNGVANIQYHALKGAVSVVQHTDEKKAVR